MANKDILSVIEELLEADMTKKDDIKNPQDKMDEADKKMEKEGNAVTAKAAKAKMDGKDSFELDGKKMPVTISKDTAKKVAEADDEEEMEEASTDVINKTTSDNADGNDKPKSGQQSSDTQGVLGSEKGTAMDAGGDKDVGGSKGDNASDASADTQGVEGKTSGAALDAGGDKDVGKIGSKEKGNPSDASAEVEADKGPHNQAEETDMEKEEDEMEEAVVPKKEGGVANDAQRPPEEKGDNAPKDTGKDVDSGAKEGPHDQSSDPHDTATKANPKTKISEEDDEEEMEEAMSSAMKAAEACGRGMSEKKACEEYGCSMEELHAAMKKEAVDPELDKDGDGDHDMDDHKAEAKEMDDDEAMSEADDKDDEEAMSEGDEGDMDGDGKDEPDSKEYMDNKDKAIKAAMKKDQKEADDDMDDEEAMSEEFKQKASVIFETAVNEKVSTIREELEEAYDVKLEEVKAEMNEKVSEYVDYAVQEWLKENSLEIKYSLRTEIAENFIRGLKGLFEESYIEIPEEEFSVVDELTESVESYKEQLEETTDELSALKEEILSLKRKEIVDEISEDLTETQKIRLEKLSESVEAEDIDEFRFKLEELKEGYFDAASEQPLLGSLSEEVYGGVVIEEDDTSVSQYAKFLSKTVLK